jgi:putative ABC transport system permease protein
MAIPLKYNLRNLRVRWRSTAATVAGIALVVAVFVLVLSLDRGIKSTYVNTGDDRNLLVLRKGATAESSSQISRAQARQSSTRRGLTGMATASRWRRRKSSC